MQARLGELSAAEKAEAEARVAARLDAGDTEGAVVEALRSYGPAILGFLHKVTKSDDVGDDVFGMFCEDLWKGIDTFERRSAFGTWAYGLAWRAACRYWREGWNKRRAPLPSSAAERLVMEVKSSIPPHQRTAAREWLRELREELKPDDLALMDLRLGKELPLEEVAGILGITHEAARQRWSRVKKRLAKKAEQDGIGRRDG